MREAAIWADLKEREAVEIAKKALDIGETMYLNRYRCDDCDVSWEDEWSCMCDDDCPRCGARISTLPPARTVSASPSSSHSVGSWLTRMRRGGCLFS